MAAEQHSEHVYVTSERHSEQRCALGNRTNARSRLWCKAQTRISTHKYPQNRWVCCVVRVTCTSPLPIRYAMIPGARKTVRLSCGRLQRGGEGCMGSLPSSSASFFNSARIRSSCVASNASFSAAFAVAAASASLACIFWLREPGSGASTHDAGDSNVCKLHCGANATSHCGANATSHRVHRHVHLNTEVTGLNTGTLFRGTLVFESDLYQGQDTL